MKRSMTPNNAATPNLSIPSPLYYPGGSEYDPAYSPVPSPYSPSISLAQIETISPYLSPISPSPGLSPGSSPQSYNDSLLSPYSPYSAQSGSFNTSSESIHSLLMSPSEMRGRSLSREGFLTQGRSSRSPSATGLGLDSFDTLSMASPLDEFRHLDEDDYVEVASSPTCIDPRGSVQSPEPEPPRLCVASEAVLNASMSRRKKAGMFKCHICPRDFTARHNLTSKSLVSLLLFFSLTRHIDHINAHNNKREHKCTFCESAFCTAAVLSRHIKTKHAEHAPVSRSRRSRKSKRGTAY